jgi:hypothetical protein
MNCDEIQPLLIDLLYGEIDPGDVDRLQRHLRDCEACRAEREALQRTVQSLDAWSPVESPCDARILAAVAAREAGRPRRDRARGVLPWFAGLAAGLLLLLGLLALNADLRYAGGGLQLSLGRSEPTARQPEEAVVTGIVDQAIGDERRLVRDVIEGRMEEWETRQQQQYMALIDAIRSARAQDREQLARLVEALAVGVAEDTRRTREVVDGVIQLVAMNTTGSREPESFQDMEIVP